MRGMNDLLSDKTCDAVGKLSGKVAMSRKYKRTEQRVVWQGADELIDLSPSIYWLHSFYLLTRVMLFIDSRHSIFWVVRKCAGQSE